MRENNAIQDQAGAGGELIEMAKNGDLEAFQKLVDLYSGRVHSIAYQLTDNSDDAEDISQEVFLKLYRSLNKYDSRLIGVWGAPGESDETWTFEKSGGNAYRLVVRNEGIEELEGEKYRLVTEIDPVRDGIFEVHLVKLGEYLFFDVYPEEPEIGNELFMSHIVPAHSFMRIKITESHLSLCFKWCTVRFEDHETESIRKKMDFSLDLSTHGDIFKFN